MSYELYNVALVELKKHVISSLKCCVISYFVIVSIVYKSYKEIALTLLTIFRNMICSH